MTVHIGLIGCGNISRTHARAVATIPGAKSVAVFGPQMEKVQRFCQEFGCRPYCDLPQFISHRPLDAVIVGSPSGLHAFHGIEAAKSGLHVLVEKPMDISSKQAHSLIQACQAAKVKLGVIFQDRLQPDICRLKKLIDGGMLGRPLLADARVKWFRSPEYYRDSGWRGTFALDGGGALMNQGIHTVDLLLWLLGDVLRVQSSTATLLHRIEVEDTAIALLEFASGTMGVLQATTVAYPGFPRQVEITGSEGTAILAQDRIVAMRMKAAGDGEEAVAQHCKNADGRSQSACSPAVEDFGGHRRIIADFLRAIDEDGRPACDGHEGLRSVALVESIYRAAHDRLPAHRDVQ